MHRESLKLKVQNKFCKVFPNPNAGKLTILINNEKAKYIIINSMGINVASSTIKNGNNTLDFHYPSGVYEIIITDKDNNLWKETLIIK